MLGNSWKKDWTKGAQEIEFAGAPGVTRTRNPQIRSRITFSVVSSSSVFLSSLSLSSHLPFILFWLVSFQSGSTAVAGQPWKSRPNPQIVSLITRKKRHENATLKAAATTLLPLK